MRGDLIPARAATGLLWWFYKRRGRRAADGGEEGRPPADWPFRTESTSSITGRVASDAPQPDSER